MMTKHYCGQCNAYIRLDFCPACFERTNEVTSSPLESVVQGRPDRPVPLNPDRSGHAILAELRARAEAEKKRTWQAFKSEERKRDHEWAWYYDGKRDGYLLVLQWLDELAPPTNNAAPDTTSGSAGVP